MSGENDVFDHPLKLGAAYRTLGTSFVLRQENVRATFAARHVAAWHEDCRPLVDKADYTFLHVVGLQRGGVLVAVDVLLDDQSVIDKFLSDWIASFAVSRIWLDHVWLDHVVEVGVGVVGQSVPDAVFRAAAVTRRLDVGLLFLWAIVNLDTLHE